MNTNTIEIQDKLKEILNYHIDNIHKKKLLFVNVFLHFKFVCCHCL